MDSEPWHFNLQFGGRQLEPVYDKCESVRKGMKMSLRHSAYRERVSYPQPVNLKQKVIGIPIFVWVIVAILIGTVVAATVISNVLTTTTNVTGGTPPVQISWYQSIPAATTVGQSYSWSISSTVSTGQSYTASLVIDLSAAIPLSDPTIITVTAGSQAGGSQAPNPISFVAQANGHLEGSTVPLTVPSGTNIAQFLGTWTFNSNTPSTSYTIQFWFQA